LLTIIRLCQKSLN